MICLVSLERNPHPLLKSLITSLTHLNPAAHGSEKLTSEYFQTEFPSLVFIPVLPDSLLGRSSSRSTLGLHVPGFLK